MSMNLVDLLTTHSVAVEMDEKAAAAPTDKPYLLVSELLQFQGTGDMCLQSNPCQHIGYFTIELKTTEEQDKAMEKRGRFVDTIKQIQTSVNGENACIVYRMLGQAPDPHFKEYDDELGDDFVLPNSIEFTKFVLQYDASHPTNVERQKEFKEEIKRRIEAEIKDVQLQVNQLMLKIEMLQAKYAKLM